MFDFIGALILCIVFMEWFSTKQNAKMAEAQCTKAPRSTTQDKTTVLRSITIDLETTDKPQEFDIVFTDSSEQCLTKEQAAEICKNITWPRDGTYHTWLSKAKGTLKSPSPKCGHGVNCDCQTW